MVEYNLYTIFTIIIDTLYYTVLLVVNYILLSTVNNTSTTFQEILKSTNNY